ncbi:transporter substrate-binding domain-containing protein [Gracilibacillus thailandensis]|uniref:Transporter substrate-binding domain-containing protein n=2 Tax=Gracilibacillus thailandensis TaxID=563735 RepID=A0A6N7R220_9BACI|nr:transporter substrate-binding domain-containing protein [Gracilibacillus thailandensis]
MMNKQKKDTFANKMVLIALVGIITFALAGCGTGDEDNSNASDQTKEEITVAVVQDYPPFEYKVDDELTGFDVELVEAIAEKADLAVNWEIMKFDGIIPALQANQVDAAVSAIGIREDRLEVVHFSDPYFESGLSLITLEDSDIEEEADLEGKTIVAKQGTSSLELANELADEYNGEVTKLQDDATMYMELENSNADAVINDYPSVAYKINQDGEDSELRLVGDKYPSEDYGVAISKGSEELVEKINTGLQELKDSGEFDELYSEYFSE